MKTEDVKRRFLFVPVVFGTVLVLIFLYKLVLISGLFNQSFDEIDKTILNARDDITVSASNKGPLIPKTKPHGRGNLDINNASVDEFDALPQIGKKRAEAIVSQRIMMGGFSTLNDLLCTDGIGIKIFNEIEPYIKITEYTGND